jgi:hypothetical protein
MINLGLGETTVQHGGAESIIVEGGNDGTRDDSPPCRLVVIVSSDKIEAPEMTVFFAG